MRPCFRTGYQAKADDLWAFAARLHLNLDGLGVVDDSLAKRTTLECCIRSGARNLDPSPRLPARIDVIREPMRTDGFGSWTRRASVSLQGTLDRALLEPLDNGIDHGPYGCCLTCPFRAACPVQKSWYNGRLTLQKGGIKKC